jgi:hypothetical protein
VREPELVPARGLASGPEQGPARVQALEPERVLVLERVPEPARVQEPVRVQVLEPERGQEPEQGQLRVPQCLAKPLVLQRSA